MSPPPPQGDDRTRGSFLRYLGWTILLGCVFGVGLIAGRWWVQEDDTSFVRVDGHPSTSGRADAGSVSGDASSTPDASDDASARPRIELSFYDRLSKGIAPQHSAGSGGGSAHRPRRAGPVAEHRPDASSASSRERSSSGDESSKGSVRYTLQISAHRKLEYAKKRMKTLEKKGLDPYLVTAELDGEGTYYRVRLGRFASMEEAEAFKRAVERKRGVDASIMPF